MRISVLGWIVLIGAASCRWASGQEPEPRPDPVDVPVDAPATDAPAAARAESLTKWRFRMPVELPRLEAKTYCELIITPEVFDQAQPDLNDLRLYDAKGREIPFALQTRSPKRERVLLPSQVFNEVDTADKAREITLDLAKDVTERRLDEAPDEREHNEIVVNMGGAEYRRAIVVEGSDDRTNWSKLLESQLLNFRFEETTKTRKTFSYPPSRFRYLRIRVSRDSPSEETAPMFLSVDVYRQIDVPGEFVTREAKLGPREPVRSNGNPSSAWRIDLGGRRVPCSELVARVAGTSFSRSMLVEQEFVDDLEQSSGFGSVWSGEWERKAGDTKPQVTKFGEQRAQRLRLVVHDFRNPPLRIESIEYRAVARVLVFAADPELPGPLHLYLGNAEATTPVYDFGRQLPSVLPEPTRRLSLGERESNPEFVAELPPLTERLPWLVYVVLGIAVLGLGGLIVNLFQAATASRTSPLASPIG